MGDYDSQLDEQGKMFTAPKHHRVNMEGYLRSYLYSPALYLLSVTRARHVMEAHCGSEEPQEVRVQRDPRQKELPTSSKERQSNTQKVKTYLLRLTNVLSILLYLAVSFFKL